MPVFLSIGCLGLGCPVRKVQHVTTTTVAPHLGVYLLYTYRRDLRRPLIAVASTYVETHSMLLLFRKRIMMLIR